MANKDQVLDNVIYIDQCGWFIGNSIILIKVIYEWADTFEVNGFITNFDLEIALDSLE